MCTLKFKVLEGKLGANLPKDVGVQTTPEDPVEKFKIQLRVVKAGNKVVWDGDGKTWVPYTGADAEAGRHFNYDDSRVIEYTYQGSNTTTNLEVVRERLAAIYKTLKEETRVEVDPRSDTC